MRMNRGKAVLRAPLSAYSGLVSLPHRNLGRALQPVKIDLLPFRGGVKVLNRYREIRLSQREPSMAAIAWKVTHAFPSELQRHMDDSTTIRQTRPGGMHLLSIRT